MAVGIFNSILNAELCESKILCLEIPVTLTIDEQIIKHG